MKSIAVFIGTRPELIKCMPLINSSSIYVPVFVEQHSDMLSDIYKSSKYNIIISETSNNRLNNIIVSILKSDIFNIKWDAIMVQGDTAVAFAAALYAFNKGIKVIHLEAGLRTYNNEHPYPEEGYRKMIDAIANVALCPSNNSADNLKCEKFSGDIYIVGNTVIDAIKSYNLKPFIGNKVIITLHRRENWYQIKDFFIICELLANKYNNLEFILPIHPNPIIKKYENMFKKVKVVNPLTHFEMSKLLEEANCIITDSGGIQEEAVYLGKHIFCCRKVTERVELIDKYITFTEDPIKLKNLFKPQEILLPYCLIYGNGDACIKINNCLF
jgi:UDP-N-acetylglucosamine 2-epimerase (non-hydrolysing)